ncbi:MAG: pyruvate kinase [Gammaproteobacteria bacterium]|jgi:pyruvate kinase|nr:pyruvate kinase [Gammaproteobacteria bacterium]MDP6616691.1 pyruvate kinase [Gammaproteobacteria bacterium]MDP6694712.1 pyruvate kinase [Gammaproteobacteria bacterium]
MRRTKIIATLGPATDDPKVLRQLLEAGTDTVRINFSHGDWSEQERRINAVRESAAELGRYVSVLGDLQGPKIRIRRFKKSPVILEEGQEFILDSTLAGDAGTSKAVAVAYEGLSGDVEKGDTLLLDDGHLNLLVEKVKGPRIICKVVVGGELSDRKGINRQGGGLSAAALTDKDREDIKLAAGVDVDWIAVSFVRGADDVNEARQLLRDAGGTGHVVAKIERSEAIESLESIIDASDAVMVARGDLGVECGYAGLTGLQKQIIRNARHRHKISITATQMMESMIRSQVPTRAEVSDVANAVMDGTDAVMLSAETAVGEHPVRAVETMAEVCVGAEEYRLISSPRRHEEHFEYVDQAIAMAVMYTANHMDVHAIIALTESGSTALWMSRIRSDIPIYAFSRHKATLRRVSLYRGVYPVLFDVTHTSTDSLYRDIFDRLLSLGQAEEGDLLIFTKGDMRGVAGGTNAMTVLRMTSQ